MELEPLDIYVLYQALTFLSSIVWIGGKMAKIWMVLVKSTKLE
jgi:hypothetical protein